MLLNTVAAMTQLLSGYEWLDWYGGGPGRESVSELAAQLGRYSGVINQPAEAGVLYSLAALCAVYRLRERPLPSRCGARCPHTGRGPLSEQDFPSGGAATVSDCRRETARQTRGQVVGDWARPAGAWGSISLGLLPRWSGLTFLLRLLPGGSDQNAVVLFSANRYDAGGGGTLGAVVKAAMDGPRFFGYGARGLAVPYDSGWVEALLVAGLAGVVLQAAVLGIVMSPGGSHGARRSEVSWATSWFSSSGHRLVFLSLLRTVATVVWILVPVPGSTLLASTRRVVGVATAQLNPCEKPMSPDLPDDAVMCWLGGTTKWVSS